MKNQVNQKVHRKVPNVKKFWCAYHRDAPNKGCWSNSCADLKKLADVQKRIQILKENDDCLHCCGDHKPSDCYKKERTCGDGKGGRGCSNAHKIHELFSADAKLCFSVQEVNQWVLEMLRRKELFSR